MPNIAEIAKQTIVTINKRGLKPTPENYSEIFEELASKYGISSPSKAKLEKYQALLLPSFQREIASKNIKSIDELLSFLISSLNRQNGKQFNDFYELLSEIAKTAQISRDKKIRELAKITMARISKAMDSDNINLLIKKWRELESTYEDSELDMSLRPFGVSKFDDFDMVIKKLIAKLNERSFEYFAKLIAITLSPSLVEDLKINGFIQNFSQKPFLIMEKNFRNELLSFVNHRILVDNMFVQKNLNFFDENLAKIQNLFSLISKTNEQNLNYINKFRPNERGEVILSFDEIKQKFAKLQNSLNILNAQIMLTKNLKEREEWSVAKELAVLDENFLRYKINYAVALFSITNYREIMERYGIGSLNEIYVRFKKILTQSCGELEELWMIDEKSYLIISPNKAKEDIENLVKANLSSIENLKFIYKQDIIKPIIKASYIDKLSFPSSNLLNELLANLEEQEQNNEI